MKYIKRITLEESGQLKMWIVFIFYTDEGFESKEFATLKEALEFVNLKYQDEVNQDALPF